MTRSFSSPRRIVCGWGEGVGAKILVPNEFNRFKTGWLPKDCCLYWRIGIEKDPIFTTWESLYVYVEREKLGKYLCVYRFSPSSFVSSFEKDISGLSCIISDISKTTLESWESRVSRFRRYLLRTFVSKQGCFEIFSFRVRSKPNVRHQTVGESFVCST